MKRHSYALWVAGTALSLAAIAAPSAASGSNAVASASACTPATNIEAIVDDSGSMSITDSSTLRVKGLKLLINTLSSTTSLGAVEFGGNFGFGSTPPSHNVFPPHP